MEVEAKVSEQSLGSRDIKQILLRKKGIKGLDLGKEKIRLEGRMLAYKQGRKKRRKIFDIHDKLQKFI